jgi:hypothetical protein
MRKLPIRSPQFASAFYLAHFQLPINLKYVGNVNRKNWFT